MRYEIGFGVGFDKNNKPIDEVYRDEAIELVLKEASLRFGGCNITSGQGAWLDDDGTLVVEESRVLTIDVEGVDPADISKFGEYVRKLFNQKAVHITSIIAASVDQYEVPRPVLGRAAPVLRKD